MIHIVLSAWQQHTLVELGGILGNILEYDRPGDVAQRLEEIARELRRGFIADETFACEGEARIVVERHNLDAAEQAELEEMGMKFYQPGQEGDV